MEDLQVFESECTLFGEHIRSFDEAIAQYENVEDFGNSIIMISDPSTNAKLIQRIKY